MITAGCERLGIEVPIITTRGCGSTAGRGNDLARQFPLIAEALARLRSRSCILDGEAVACDEKTGIACFDRLRHHLVDETGSSTPST